MEHQQSTSIAEERLSYEQVAKLDNSFQKVFEVHGRGNFPTLEITLKKLVQQVKERLALGGIRVVDVRLNGSLASHILVNDQLNPLSYNDIDLIFSVHLDGEETLLKIKDFVIDCLKEYLPENINKDRLSNVALADAYVGKLTKVWMPAGDKWSLITLSNNVGMNLELKFVDTMKRKFQFSVDSFQIILDSLTKFYDVSAEHMSPDFYPSVIAESMYGNFGDALDHLNNRLIATHSPQEIRGGGLLKYCDLLSKGYQPAYTISEIEKLERLMCSRFFIDYSDLPSQFQKLNAYLINHFCGNYAAMLPYLSELYRVVSESTVCLMGHERRQALDLIHHTALNVQYEYERQLMEMDYNQNYMQCCGCSGCDESASVDSGYSTPVYYNHSPQLQVYTAAPANIQQVC